MFILQYLLYLLFYNVMVEFRFGVFGFGGKNVLRKFLIRFDSLINSLHNISIKRSSLERKERSGFTISSLPSITAINPPVLVPQITSKSLQGRGIDLGSFGLSAASCRDAWTMSSFRMYKDEIPLTPPPSSERIRNGGRFSEDACILSSVVRAAGIKMTKLRVPR